MSSSVKVFEARLDSFWKNQPMKSDYKNFNYNDLDTREYYLFQYTSMISCRPLESHIFVFNIIYKRHQPLWSTGDFLHIGDVAMDSVI